MGKIASPSKYSWVRNDNKTPSQPSPFYKTKMGEEIWTIHEYSQELTKSITTVPFVRSSGLYGEDCFTQQIPLGSQ
jgi:hypothetical protein